MVHIFVQSRTRAQYVASWEKGLEYLVRIFRRVNPYIIYWRKLTACLVWGQTVVLREFFYMSVFFIWLWFTLCNDKMTLILKWQSYTDLLLIICRFILGKTVVLKWVTHLSFWNDFTLSFRDDFMPFILKWSKVSLALKCLDCSLSCQPQNDNNFSII